MNVKQINKEYGHKMLEALTLQDAAVVFMVGLKKDGKVANVMTTDMKPHQLQGSLKHAIHILQTELDKLSSPK